MKACILLSMSGLEMPAFVHLRDLVEVEYLLKFFILNPEKIALWLNANRKTRLREYKPDKIRMAISENDTELRKRLDTDYAGHSDLLTHLTPPSLNLQRGMRVKLERNSNDKSMVYSCLTEVAYHGKEIAIAVSFLGELLSKKDIIKEQREKLQNNSKFLNNYTLIATVLIGEKIKLGM